MSEAAGAALVLVLLGAGSAFAVNPAPDQQLSPVPFEETLATGMTGVDVQVARQAGYEIPRAQAFHAQFRFVVGYYGIGTAAGALADETTTERFGRPLAVFVTDYRGTEPRLTDDEFVVLRNEGYRTWTAASEAVYVVDSRARTPGGPAILPFSDRADARAFADRAGGRVVGWDEVATARDPAPWDAVLAERTTARTAWADAAVERTRSLLDRPVSVTVGEDAPTLGAAVERAPPNTTVRVPPGRYNVDLDVEKPVTIQGAGDATVLDGGGTGTVVTLDGPQTALADVRVTGVGDRDIGNVSARNATGWDARIQLIYGYGDAGVRLADATDAIVTNVTVETPANGVVLLESDGAVVDGVRVNGTAVSQEGFMGALPMHSRVVIQDSTFRGGRDGVYTHRADGSVVRNNSMAGGRFGLHEMYTSDLLIAGNAIRDTQVGIILMTRPRGNVVAGNDVRHSDGGIYTVGSATVVARNVVAGNDVGLAIGTDRSVYARNTIVGNDLGIREDSLLPTNEVFASDVVLNDRPVETGRGVLLVWAREGVGNYWGEVPGIDRDGDGLVDRGFRPTDPLDRSALESSGSALLGRSPAVSLGRAFQGAVPGLRPSGVLDPAPRVEPVRPEILAAVRTETVQQPGGASA
ncbi:MAG: NosD domain-containing protein [Haloarculaceae archaeon]